MNANLFDRLHIFLVVFQGKKMCMHVHGVFPYLYVLVEDEPDDSYLTRLAQAIDKGINISLGRPTSYMQHVFNINVVHGM